MQLIFIRPLFSNNWDFLNLSLVVNIILVTYVIFVARKNSSSAWAWILIMLFFPILGFILYLFIGQGFYKRKTFNKKEEEDTYRHLIHGQEIRLASALNEFDTLSNASYSGVLKLNLLGHQSLYTNDNTIDIFTDGPSKFNQLFEDIKAAKEFIHLEYYIIRHDTLGNYLKEILIEKAKSGVKVILLYDGMGCLWVPKAYFNELVSAGIKVTSFFPPFIPYINLRVNYRNHRKIVVIDNKIAYLGGFNIGNEYMGLNKRMGFWRDTHLRLTGSSVQMLNMQFLLDYRFASKEDIPLPTYTPYSDSTGACGMQIVSSGPDSKQPCVRNSYLKMLAEAKESIYLQTPYFIPDEALLTALKLAALSGVDVKIMIPNKPDHMFVYWASYSYVGEILQTGAKCYTYEKGFLHAKTLIIDNAMCSVGTANFDLRSLNLNFEVNAFIYDKFISESLTKIFQTDLMDCSQITNEIYQSRSNLIKFKESIARLLSPIL